MTTVSPMAPVPYRVEAVHRDTHDVVTLELQPHKGPGIDPGPGQFVMLYALGIGEAPISLSGCPAVDGAVRCTIRRAGAVTNALCDLQPGGVCGVRGPFGIGWPVGPSAGADLVLVAGGIGLAPLRPVIRHAVAAGAGDRTTIVVGARRPDNLLYLEEVDTWRDAGVDVLMTVDVADPDWTGPVGVVTELLGEAVHDAAGTVAMICGPETMMRIVAEQLVRDGVDPASVFVSLERNMHCALGHCGHCQLGPRFVCLDGPVVSWDDARPLLEVRSW